MTGIDLDADLAAFMEAEFDLPDDGPYETPKDERTVNGMLWALSAKHRELARITEHADEQIRVLKAWREDRTAGLAKRIADLERVLEGYARGVLAGRTKDKKLAYPNGVLQLRSKPVRPVVVDEVECEMWATSDETRKALLTETVTKLKLQELCQVASRGPELDEVTDDDGVVWQRWSAVWGDEIIPGVEIRRPKEDGFTASPA